MGWCGVDVKRVKHIVSEYGWCFCKWGLDWIDVRDDRNVCDMTER